MDTRTLAPTVDKERLAAIVQTILREPTAPFHETRVRHAIVGLLRSCRRVTVREDDFGNLIAHSFVENARELRRDRHRSDS